MINVLMCTYKSGDVLPLSLKPLVDFPGITKILIADGPHGGPIKPGIKFDEPSVYKIAEKFNKSGKIHYEYTDTCKNRALKNNSVLKHTTDDCKWILNVDSDEVYHEDTPDRGVAEIIILKQRNGPIGRKKLAFIGQYTKFEDLARDYDDYYE